MTTSTPLWSNDVPPTMNPITLAMVGFLQRHAPQLTNLLREELANCSFPGIGRKSIRVCEPKFQCTTTPPLTAEFIIQVQRRRSDSDRVASVIFLRLTPQFDTKPATVQLLTGYPDDAFGTHSTPVKVWNWESKFCDERDMTIGWTELLTIIRAEFKVICEAFKSQLPPAVA